MKSIVAIALASTLFLTCPVSAQDCSSSVQTAQDNIRNSFVQGMSGLITNNFSSRPSSFGSMACLDNFMQGNMDIMFKPPSLTDLLGTVMNFACQGSSQVSGSQSMPNLSGLIGSLAGGLNLGSSGTVNLSSVLSGALHPSSSFAASSGTSGSGGGISNLYSISRQ